MTSFCKKDCLYCGLRRTNKNAQRYRLSKEEVLECVRAGDKLGYKTIVLQGGEDAYFNDEVMVDIIKSIKKEFPNNAHYLLEREVMNLIKKCMMQVLIDIF